MINRIELSKEGQDLFILLSPSLRNYFHEWVVDIRQRNWITKTRDALRMTWCCTPCVVADYSKFSPAAGCRESNNHFWIAYPVSGDEYPNGGCHISQQRASSTVRFVIAMQPCQNQGRTWLTNCQATCAERLHWLMVVCQPRPRANRGKSFRPTEDVIMHELRFAVESHRLCGIWAKAELIPTFPLQGFSKNFIAINFKGRIMENIGESSKERAML